MSQMLGPHILTPWLFITLALGAMALVAVWARRKTLFRGAAVLLFVVAAPFAGLALATTLGWAVPIIPGLTAVAGDDVEVIGVKLAVGEGIFVLVDDAGGEPRYYRIEWNRKLADEIQDMMDNPDRGGLRMKIPGEKGDGKEGAPFEWSWDTHPPQFYAPPQPKVLPDKPQQAEPPSFDADREI